MNIEADLTIDNDTVGPDRTKIKKMPNNVKTMAEYKRQKQES